MKRLLAAVIVLSSLADQVAAEVRRPHPGAGHTQRLLIRFAEPAAGLPGTAPQTPSDKSLQRSVERSSEKLPKMPPEQPQKTTQRYPAWAGAIGVERELAQRASVEALAQRKSVTLHRLREAAAADALVVALPRAVSLDEARELSRRLAADPAVVLAEPDVRVFTQQVSDPLFGLQWSLPGPGNAGGAVGGIGVTDVWPISTGGGITVAVIDTGYTSHPDLNAAWLAGQDFISGDSDGSFETANDGSGRDIDATDPGDWCAVDGTTRASSWHGTAVAGIIAAQANNGFGVVGAAPGVRLLPVRAIGRCGGYMSDVMDAMRWAAGLPVAGVALNPNPAKILNLSLGSSPGVACSALQQQVVDEIVAANVLIVAAAGNEGTASIGAPANCSQVLAVAAHTRQGELAAYSNFHAAVALTAPGGTGATAATAIIASGNAGVTSPGTADPGRAFVGTSAATPHVAAAAAVLWAMDPARPAIAIRNALSSAARPWPVGTPCSGTALGRCGAGMLDVGAAVARLHGQVAVEIARPGGTFAGKSAVDVTATASSQYAPSELTYRWVQTSGAAAVLARSDTASVRVTLPPRRTTVGLRVTVSDPQGKQTIGDAVLEVNNPPMAKSMAPIVAGPGEAIARSLNATDTDGDPVHYTLLEGPPGITVGRSDGLLAWTAPDAGSYQARVGIEDGYGQRGEDILVELEVGEQSSTSSLLRAARGGSGGGGAPGRFELALVVLALMWLQLGRRKGSRTGVMSIHAAGLITTAMDLHGQKSLSERLEGSPPAA